MIWCWWEGKQWLEVQDGILEKDSYMKCIHLI